MDTPINPHVMELLRHNFYFLKDSKEGICPKCMHIKPVIMGAGKCLDCMIEEQTFKAIDKNQFDKSYVRHFLNTGKFINSQDKNDEIDIAGMLFTVINDIWENAKTAYYEEYLALQPKEPFSVYDA